MPLPRDTGAYARQWHDLATRFEEGMDEITSPPFTTLADAQRFRQKWYGFKGAMRKEAGAGPVLYPTLEQIAVYIEAGGASWVVRFERRDNGMDARVLSDMLGEP